MSRWRNLDFEPAEGSERIVPEDGADAGEAPRERRRYRALAGMAPPRHPVVAAARGLYLLKNWQGVVNALSPALLSEPEAGEGWVLLGLARARLGEEDAAEAAFDAA